MNPMSLYLILALSQTPVMFGYEDSAVKTGGVVITN
jgi:hypothetical protein